MSSKEYPPRSAEGDRIGVTVEHYSSQQVDIQGTVEEHQTNGWTRFLALWTVSGANYFAYATMKLALVLFAIHLTRSPLLVSGIVFTQLFPAFVFGLPAGALVDRYDRRFVLISTTTVRVVAFALMILVALIGRVSLPLLYALALLLGITETLEEPALAAAVPMVVPQAKLERANTLLVGAQNMIGLLADPLGALIAGISIALTMSFGTFFAALALIALMCLRGTLRSPFTSSKFDADKDAKREAKPRHSVRQVSGYTIGTDILEGLSYLRNERLLLTIGLMAGVINACWEGYLVVMVLYAVKPGPLGLTSFIYGILLMSISIGSIMGAFLTIPVQHWLGKRWAIGLNILGNGLMFIAPAFTHNLWLIGAAMLLGGIGSPMWTIAAAALQARIVPPDLQGRVNASYRILAIGGSVLGPILAGILVQSFGFSITFIFFGILTWLQFVPFFNSITEHAITRNTLNWNADESNVSPLLNGPAPQRGYHLSPEKESDHVKGDK